MEGSTAVRTVRYSRDTSHKQLRSRTIPRVYSLMSEGVALSMIFSAATCKPMKLAKISSDGSGEALSDSATETTSLTLW